MDRQIGQEEGFDDDAYADLEDFLAGLWMKQFCFFPHCWVVETIWRQTTSRSSSRAEGWLLLERSAGSFESRARKDCSRLCDMAVYAQMNSLELFLSLHVVRTVVCVLKHINAQRLWTGATLHADET
jgi:hypothetical protein